MSYFGPQYNGSNYWASNYWGGVVVPVPPPAPVVVRGSAAGWWRRTPQHRGTWLPDFARLLSWLEMQSQDQQRTRETLAQQRLAAIEKDDEEILLLLGVIDD